MSLMWRSHDVARPERVEYMRQAVCDSIMPFDLRFDHGADCRGEIRTAEFGPVRVTYTHGSGLAGEAARTPRLIRRSDPELCKIDLQLRDHAVFEQDDRQAGLRAGDFSFVDLSRPCRLMGSFEEIAVVIFPRALLPLAYRDIKRLTGFTFPGREATTSLVSSVVGQVSRDLSGYDGVSGAGVGRAILDLITTALASRLDVDLPPEASRRTLLLRIHGFIEERLGDPLLAPPLIAAAHHISLRYLHKLFESEGRTVSAWIRARRLERCRHDLLDPALAAKPVSAIGSRWGFPDPAYFSRVFRECYGAPPGEYRRSSA